MQKVTGKCWQWRSNESVSVCAHDLLDHTHIVLIHVIDAASGGRGEVGQEVNRSVKGYNDFHYN